MSDWSIPGYDAWKLASPPEYDGPPEDEPTYDPWPEEYGPPAPPLHGAHIDAFYAQLF